MEPKILLAISAGLLVLAVVLYLATRLSNWGAHMSRGFDARREGRADKAEQEFRTAWGKLAGLKTPDRRQAWTLKELAAACLARGKHQEAEDLALRSLSLHQRLLDPASPHVAAAFHTLACIYKAEGSYDRAEPLLQHAIGVREAALGPDHESLAAGLNDLAEIYVAEQKYAQAEPLCWRALLIREKSLGLEDTAVADSLVNLADIQSAEQRISDAERLYNRALMICEKSLPAGRAVAARASNGLARIRFSEHRFSEAESLLKRALRFEAPQGKSAYARRIETLDLMAENYLAQECYAEAEVALRQSLELKERCLGLEDPQVGACLDRLATALIGEGRLLDAEACLNHSFAIREALASDKPAAVLEEARKIRVMSVLYLDHSNPAAAEMLARRAVYLIQNRAGSNTEELLSSYENLVEVLYRQGKYEETEECLRRILELQERTQGAQSMQVANTLDNYASILRQLDRRQEAASIEARAHAIRSRSVRPAA